MSLSIPEPPKLTIYNYLHANNIEHYTSKCQLKYDTDTHVGIAFDKNNASAKRFFAIPKEKLNELLQQDWHIYEIIPQNKPIRFFITLEDDLIKYGNISIDEKNKKCSSTLQISSDVIELSFKLFYGAELPKNAICVLSGCCDETLLYHIIIKNTYCAGNIGDVCEFATFVSNKILELCENDDKYDILKVIKKTIINTSIHKFVYLRCANQSKWHINANSEQLKILDDISLHNTLITSFDITAVKILQFIKPMQIKPTPILNDIATQNVRKNARHNTFTNNDNVVKYNLIRVINNATYDENKKDIDNKIHVATQILENEKHDFLKYVVDVSNVTEHVFYEYWMTGKRTHVQNMFYELNMNQTTFAEICENNPHTLLKMKYISDINKILKLSGSYDIATLITRNTLMSLKHYLHDNWEIFKITFNLDWTFPNVDVTNDKNNSKLTTFIFHLIAYIYREFNGNNPIVTNPEIVKNSRRRHEALYKFSGVDWKNIIRRVNEPFQNMDTQIQQKSLTYIEMLKQNPDNITAIATNTKNKQNISPQINPNAVSVINITNEILTRNPILKQQLCEIATNYKIDFNTACNVVIKIEHGENLISPNVNVKKYTKQPISKKLRVIVWKKWIGEGDDGKCMCCKTKDISIHKFACGHVVAEACGGEMSVENLRPICKSCNSSMGMENMNDYMKRFGYT